MTTGVLDFIQRHADRHADDIKIQRERLESTQSRGGYFDATRL